jgi:hypothetical protein
MDPTSGSVVAQCPRSSASPEAEDRETTESRTSGCSRISNSRKRPLENGEPSVLQKKKSSEESSHEERLNM